jgi:hypothetical protein
MASAKSSHRFLIETGLAERQNSLTGGLTHRNGIPFGTWQDRHIDWLRDLGFLQKPGVETKAARDIAAFLAQPQRGGGPRGNGAGGQGATGGAPNGLIR